MYATLVTPIQYQKPAVSICVDGSYSGQLLSPDTEEYLRIKVLWQDEDGSVLHAQHVGFTEAEAEQWGDDDSVLLGMVIAKLGIEATPV